MPTLAERIAKYIRRQELLKAGDRVGVAVSGGVDSVALLRLLLELRKELGVVLSAVHFNHKLRGADSDADEQFVSALAHEHKLEFHSDSGEVAAHAAEQHLSLEAAAREKRYSFFTKLLENGRLDHVATAHTLDDQAETVLLRVVRGAGTRGIAGIYPKVRRQSAVPSLRSGQAESSRQPNQKTIIRPLLGVRRSDLEIYLKDINQDWREDKSNRDLRHARNRVRHGLLPRLERNLNPAVRETLAETAEIARAEEDYWQTEITRLLPQVWNPGNKQIKLKELSELPLALQRRAVRAAAESFNLRLEFRHVEEILEIASGRGKSTVLTGGWTVSHDKNNLSFDPQKAKSPANYQYPLPIPGRVSIPEIGTCLEAVVVPAEAGYNRGHLLDRSALAGNLLVRNWRAGDRFWPAHTKAPKKIKELLQERHVTGAERTTWPVVTNGSEVVWMRGFPVPANRSLRDGTREAIEIREVALG